ncbi:MAG: EMC3/TMCO1 family protein [Candidatus Woesearchaeota archaeon]|nr:EMC3/TMCO1 family protein [Candidatus Woesearchaeota archaeon]
MLDFLLGWVLNFHPALAILLLSLIISLVITLAIKYLTDQSLMKDLRSELLELQKEMKDLKNNPKKMAKINDRFMETNMKYMSHSMRPTLFTFIPIILVFGWMSTHIGYYPLLPDQAFKVTAKFNVLAEGGIEILLPEGLELSGSEMTQPINAGEVSWFLKGPKGSYKIKIPFNGKTYEKDVLITDERVYASVEQLYKKGFFAKEEPRLESITLSNRQILPFSDVPLMKDIPWIGTWGWFGTYFLFSIIFSLGLRKIFKIY